MGFPEKSKVRRTKYELVRQDAEIRSTILGKYELSGRQAQSTKYEPVQKLQVRVRSTKAFEKLEVSHFGSAASVCKVFVTKVKLL